jgi:hypothetical protein
MDYSKKYYRLTENTMKKLVLIALFVLLPAWGFCGEVPGLYVPGDTEIAGATTVTGGMAGIGSINTSGTIQARMYPGVDVSTSTNHDTEELRNTVYHVTAEATITLDAAADAGYGSCASYKLNQSGYDVTIDPQNDEILNLGGGLILFPGQEAVANIAGNYIQLCATTDADGSGTDGWEAWGNDGFANNEIWITKVADADQDVGFQLSIPAGYEVEIDWGDTNSSTVTGPQSSTDYNHSYGDTSSYTIKMSGDLRKLTEFDPSNASGGPLSGNISGMSVMSNLARFNPGTEFDSSTTGDLSGFPATITYFRIYLDSGANTGVTGNVNHIVGNGSMTYFRTDRLSISASVAELSDSTGLTYLGTNRDDGVYGSVSGLGGLTSLTSINLTNADVTGDAGVFGAATSVTSIVMGGTAVELSVDDLDGCTSLATLSMNYLGTCNYSTTTLPDWKDASISLTSCGMPESEVDTFLVDLESASGSGSGTLDLSGNATPTATGQTAIDALRVKGWTVTVQGGY